MRKLNKKQAIDLLSYSFIIMHNGQINEVITEEQFDKLITFLKGKFNNDEQASLDYIKRKAMELVRALDNTVVPNKVSKREND